MPTALQTIQSSPFLLAYFSTPDCNVCRSLLPKVRDLVSRYPRLDFLYVNVEEEQQLAGQFLVFAVPTLVLLVNGREQKRFGRFVSLAELEGTIARLARNLEGAGE